MTVSVWEYCFDGVAADMHDALLQALHGAGLSVQPATDRPCGFGLAILAHVDGTVLSHLRQLARDAGVLAIAAGPTAPSTADMWSLLSAGAADVLSWSKASWTAAQVAARVARWQAVQELFNSPAVQASAIGSSAAWRILVRSVIEIAAFTDSPVLITGETGTGKDVLAQLIHRLDRRHGRFTVLDCTTLSPELAGSELFGHERGAFTGAAVARDGAFFHADGGVLFLDEVGELPLPLQAQLLRVIQEHSYKRIGSNNWQHTEFRLVCATNRDLEREVERGHFRSDLFYRIAGWRCRPQPLRERQEDILPLVQHFLGQLAAPDPAPDLDTAVREYFLTRQYPGNVRDLRQAVARIWHRHTGPGPLTIGDVPADERPAAAAPLTVWPDIGFEDAIRHALDLGVPLSRITQGAGDLAIQVALAQEDDNNQRAAARLGVTDRALQIRRKAWSRH